MAQELEQKIEQTIADEQQNEMQFDQPAELTPAELTTEDTVAAIEEGMQRGAVPVDNTVQVAGKFDDAARWLGKRMTEAERRTGAYVPEDPIEEIGGRIVIREAGPEDVAAINSALGGDYTKGINLPRIAEDMGQFDAADYLGRLKDANAELFEKARRGTITFEMLLDAAAQQGIDNIVGDLLVRAPGSAETAEKVVGGLIGAMDLWRQTDEAFEVAMQLPAGPERDLAMNRAYQLMTAQAQLFASVSGATSEGMRMGFAVREFGKRVGMGDVATRAEVLQGLFSAANADDVEHIGMMYMALPDKRSKAQFVKQGLLAKSMDVVTEVWINSILSAPTTHMVNIFGNTSFAMMRTLETQLAAGIGKVRFWGDPDRVRAREALAQLEGLRAGLSDAFYVAGKTMVTEEGKELASKIDVRNRRAIGTTGDLRDIVTQVREGNMPAAATNALGVFVRMPGRLLLAEDEFFKGVGYRMALHQEAEVAAGRLYDQLIDQDIPVAEATLKAAQHKAQIINNPPTDIMRSSKQAAQQMTFQEDLDGVLGSLQGFSSHPLVKMFIPFYKTPTNVIKETYKRTPLAFLSPSIRAQIKAGGRDADIALARIGLGSTIAAGFAYASMGLDDPDQNMIIMGAGPRGYERRQAMARMGIQPYSINVKIYDDAGNWTGKYKSLTFSRFDPISGILAMSADFAYYSQYEADPNIVDGLAMALTTGIAEYSMQMPFLQGLQEISGIFRNKERMDEAAFEMFTKKLTDAGLSVVPGASSFMAGIERMGEEGEGAAGPVAASRLLPEGSIITGYDMETGMWQRTDITDLPSFARGFYSSWTKFKSRNPMLSDTVEPRLNLWGEKMTEGSGAGWEFVSPVRIQDTKYSAVDQEIMTTLASGIPMPQKRINGVLLNATQFNKMITDMNSMDTNGLMPGQDGYDSTMTLLPVLNQLIASPEYRELIDVEDRRTLIMNVVGEFKSAAKQKLLREDTMLGLKVMAVQ